MRHLGTLILTACCLGAAMTAITAAQSGREVVRVGVNTFRPFVFSDRDGQVSGYSIDVLRHLSDRAGLDLEFHHADSLGHMLQMLADGEVDLLPILAETPERHDVGDFTLSIGSFTNHLIVGTEGDIRHREDLDGRDVGVVAKSGSALTAAGLTDVNLVEFTSQDGLLLGLLTGQVAAVVAPTEAFLARAKAARIDHRLAVLEPPLSERPRGFLVSSARPDILSRLNAAIASDFHPADDAPLHRKWFGAANLGKPAGWIGWAAAALACVAGLALYVGHRYRDRARTLQHEVAQNQHFADALDHLDVLVIIFDRDLLPIYWNDAAERYATRQVPMLRMRRPYAEVLAHSRLNGPFLPRMTPEEAHDYATDIAERIQRGEAVRRVFKTEDGRTIEAYDARVSDGIYASVRTNVTKTAQQADLIVAQKQELESVNKRLEGFVHIAAHDLRAPLRQMASWVEFLADDLEEQYGTLPEALRESLEIIQSASTRMSRFVEDLLTYSLANTGDGATETFDVGAVLPDIVALAGLPDEARFEQDIDLPPLCLSKTEFELVLRNLIANAIKHNPSDAPLIRVIGRASGAFAEIEVQDNGPGVAPESRERIFDPFIRLGAAGGDTGNGLGLAFVRGSVESWGGRVEVDCPPRGGSIFRFTVPIEAQAAATDVVHGGTLAA